MKQRLSMQELVLIAGATLAGCFLRFSALDKLSVEHFDEGIYSADVWYQSPTGAAYPASHLYAPPALSTAIQFTVALAGPDLGPFIPGLLAGALTILLVWGFTRALFGMAAGLTVVLLTAFSDYHVLYSRMALTDVPVIMWMLLSVWLGVTGIDRQRVRPMVLAGLACGCAWWTKYTGWLPLAILGSGSLFWWVLAGRSRCSLKRLLALNLTSVLTAAAVWAPWYLALEKHGGYSAVAANHAGYLNGWAAWQENLATQLTWYSWIDSWLSGVAILLGVMCAGCQRWFDARRSTWNRNAPSGSGVTPAVLARFLSAAVLLAIATLSIGSFGTMMAVAVGGMAGVFVWPVLSVLKEESAAAISDKRSRSGAAFDEADFHASPDVDPRLSACILAAWFCGMLLMTPRYTPFPRLLLPLLTAIWIATAAGVGWWIEASVGVARRAATGGQRVPHSLLQMSLTGLVMLVAVAGVWVLQGAGLTDPTIYEPRTGLRDAAEEVAVICREAAGSEAPADASASAEPRFVVYVFGEPAALYHLNQAGVVASPVQSLSLTRASWKRTPLPTFMVFGPNALRTPGFLYDWVEIDYRYEHLQDVAFMPSQVVLYNLFGPQWLAEHPGSDREQFLEVYRLR